MSFTLDLSRMCAHANGNIGALCRKVVVDLGEGIVGDTPVGDPTTWKHPERAPAGYVGGRARGSWQYGYNAPNAADPGTIDASGQAANMRIAAGVAANQAPGVHYITSTVPYMRRLEYEAWSSQAPAGMVRKNIVDFQNHVAAAIAALPK